MAAAIPGAGASTEMNNPVVLAIAGAMKELDRISEAKAACMAEGVEKAQNFNAVDDLMQAHRGVITREAAFAKNVNEYTAHF